VTSQVVVTDTEDKIDSNLSNTECLESSLAQPIQVWEKIQLSLYLAMATFF